MRTGWHKLQEVGEIVAEAPEEEIVQRLGDYKPQLVECQLAAQDRTQHPSWRAAHDLHTRIQRV